MIIINPKRTRTWEGVLIVTPIYYKININLQITKAFTIQFSNLLFLVQNISFVFRIFANLLHKQNITFQ